MSLFGTQNKFNFGNTTPFSAGGTTSTFGASTGFGAQQPAATPATGLFSSANTSTTGGGLFGATAGSNNVFGQTTQAATGFGTTPATAGGLFGATAPAQGGGLFGTPTTSTGFGAKTPSTGGLFGTTTATAAPAAGGLFGQTAQPAAGGLFTAGAGGFGATVGQTGTAVVKFNPPTGSDSVMKSGVTQNINTRHLCITAMKEYENKSFEELRMEDYAANRKSGATAAVGATQPAGGLFGGAAQQTPVSQPGGLFGSQPKPAGFGSFGSTPASTATGGLFGTQQQPASTSLFGAAASKPSLFSAASTTTTTTSGFGGFGAPQPAATGGLFGQQPQQKPGGLFGTATTQAGGLFTSTASTGFGATSTASTGFGGFGVAAAQPATGGLFGQKPTGFGTAQPAGGGLFNKPAASTGFNFGQASAAPTGFGTAQQAGPFGAKPGGFGTTTSTLGGTTTGFGTGVGTGLGAGTSLFNNQQKPALGGGLGSMGFGVGTTGFSGLGGNTANTGLGLQGVGVANATANNPQNQLLQQQLMVLQMNPYGGDPLFSGLGQDEKKRAEVVKPTNLAAQKASLTNQHKVSPRPVAKIRPKAVQGSGKARLFEGLEEDELFGNDTFVARKSVKSLTIKRRNTIAGTHDINSSVNSSLLADTSYTNNLDTSTSILMNSPSVLGQQRRRPLSRNLSSVSDTERHSEDNGVIVGSKDIQTNVTHMPPFDETINVLNQRNSNALGTLDRTMDQTILEPVDDDSTCQPHPGGIVMHRSGYYTMPSLDELATMVDENGDCTVENLVIGREGYGNVFFPGVTNVTGLNIDEIVFFRRKEITVYPDDDKKPEVGKGLNKKAQVTLDNVWPNDKSTHTLIKSPERLTAMGYQDKIEQATAKIGAKFIEYRIDTGSWVFEVKHFSKYGLVDDSDDEGDDPALTDPAKLKLLQVQQKQQLAIQKKQIEVCENLAQQAVPDHPVLSAQERLAALEKLGPEYVDPVETEHRGGGVTAEKMSGLSVDKTDKMADMSADMSEPTQIDRMDSPMTLKRPTVDVIDEGEDMLSSSHRLAHSMEVGTKPVQHMKASFFDDMDDEPVGQFSSPQFSRLSRPVHLPASPLRVASPKPAFPSHLPTLHSTHTPSMEHESTPPAYHVKALPNYGSRDVTILPSGMPEAAPPRAVVGVRIQREAVPYVKSSFHGRHSAVMDMGLFHGRAFRVGWGPGNTIVHCAKQPIDQSERAKEKRCSILPGGGRAKPLDDTPYKVHIEKLHMAQCGLKPHPEIISHLNSCFERQLNCSVSSTDTGIPLFVPKPGRELLHQQAQLTTQKNTDLSTLDVLSDQMDTVWSLCVALWGDLHMQDEDSLDPNGHIYQMGRREAVSKWLCETAEKHIQQEVAHSAYQVSGSLQCILSYLTGRQITKACSHAQSCNEHRLALLMAQSVSSHQTRALLAKQLQTWAQYQADSFIDPLRLRIFSLLAGHMVWHTSHDIVNVCQDLDWKRSFALHLWYQCSPTTTISGGVQAYKSAYTGSSSHGQYSCPPLPPYLETDLGLHQIDSQEDVEESADLQDTCYHLLCLWSDRSYPLNALLSPATSTPDPLDFRLSWFLWQCLRSLEYSHLSSYHDAQLCSSFSSQLEALGLWHWAVFVLLHISDHHSREYSTRELLGRHIRLTDDESYIEQENFVREQLLVPASWLHYAKAMRAHHLSWHWEESYHLMKATCMNESHQVLLQHIAPDAIIHEDYTKLLQLLREMSPVEYSCAIKDWNIGGKLYLDYITMNQTIDEIKRGELGAYELEGLRPEVASLCNRIGGMICPTARHRLCQSEMAKRTANLLRTLTQLQHEAQGTDIKLPQLPAVILAPHISRLPMPEDYALQELRLLTRAYMLEMAAQ